MQTRYLLHSLLLFTVLPCTYSYAIEPNNQGPAFTANQVLRTLAGMNQANSEIIKKTCHEYALGKLPENHKKPSCAELSDNYCKALWSKENQGNMMLPDGAEIRSGKSAKSTFSQILIDDYNAIVANQDKLPPDTREKLKPFIDRLEILLKEERDEDSWYRAMSRVTTEINDGIRDIAKARLIKSNPHIATTKRDERSHDDIFLLNYEAHKVGDEIITAKFSAHPNWKNIQDIFSNAKVDIKRVVEDFKISLEEKKILLEKIEATKISLPHSQVTQGTGIGCDTTEINAFNMSDTNIVVPCGGLIHGIKDKNFLYYLLSHEIAHSIDPVNCAFEKMFRKDSTIAPLEKMVKEINYTGSACSDWNDIKKTAVKKLSDFQFQEVNMDANLQKFYNCLSSKENLIPLTTENINKVSQNITDDWISYLATEGYFSALATKIITKKGIDTLSQTYLRPDRVEQMGGYKLSEQRRMFYTELFTKIFACQLPGGASEMDLASSEEQAKLFKKSIEEMKLIIQYVQNTQITYCGQDCPLKTSYNLTINSRENFSDNIAFKAMRIALARKKNMAERQAAALSPALLFCQSDIINNKAAFQIQKIERDFSNISHNESRIRRLAVFDDIIAKMAGCTITKEEQGYGTCEL